MTEHSMGCTCGAMPLACLNPHDPCERSGLRNMKCCLRSSLRYYGRILNRKFAILRSNILILRAFRFNTSHAKSGRYWPTVDESKLVPDYSGVRPKLVGPGGSGVADFSIQGSAEHGVPGLVNLLGIESPGLTASLAIAEHVAELLQADPCA